MSDDHKIREIEKEIDLHHQKSAFFKAYSNNRTQALFDVLRVYDGLFSSVLLGGIGQEMLGLKNVNQVLLSNVHNLQDALNTAVMWIYQDCSLTTDEISYDMPEENANKAADLLANYADPYSVIVDGYISYSRKQNMGRVEGNRVIFDSTKEQLESFLYDVGDKINSNHDRFLEMIMSMCLSPEFQTELNEFAQTIRIEEGRLCYNTSAKLWDYAHNIGCKHWEETSCVPQEWEFDHFSLLDFKNCWTIIYAVCLIHFFARLKSGLPGMAHEDAVIVLPKNVVVKCIDNYSHIGKEKAEAVVDFLTYDSRLPNTDIMYQPIVSSGNLLIITPTLILTSNPERNLIAVIQKKKDSKYSVEVNDLEDIMADELISSLPEKAVHSKSKHLTKELPDVDFAVYDSDTNALLIAEMKWLIAADSTKEVLERRKDIDHGCSQVEAIMDYAMRDPVTFANRILPISISERPDLFWCVVAKHDIRSTNSLVPVISEDSFIELIKGYSLSTAFHKIRNRQFYKPLPASAKMDHKKVRYAGYEFWIPALVIEKEYEIWE